MTARATEIPQTPQVSRRTFLGAAASLAALAATAQPETKETYETQAKGIRILPGHWRPHYPWEHIAWISPSWPSQDYLWFDFPEAIFSSQGLLFLSHINPPIPTVYASLPAAPWDVQADGISFERVLPSGISFGGSLKKSAETVVDLELHIDNGSKEPLNDIELQTCAFLRGIKEFGDYTRENKFIHTPEQGWISMEAARALPQGGTQPYRVGWRSRGNPVSDVPMIITQSNVGDRFFALTWRESTLSMVSNPNHPCAHADPKFPNLPPGARASIAGKLVFFEGKLADFDYGKYIGG